MGKDKSPDIPQQSLSMDIDKILKRFRKDIVPEFNRWQDRRPELRQLDEFTQGTMIPRLTQLLSQFPNINQAIDPLQRILNNQPNVNIALAPVQQISRALQSRMGNLMNVAPVLARGLASQAPIISSGGAPTMRQNRDAQQAALQTMSLGGQAHGNQAAVADVLKRWQLQQQNMQNAIQNVSGLEGIQGQDVAARLGLGQGVIGAQNAQDQIRNADIQRRMGLTSGIQSIRGTNIAQQLGLMQGITGAIEQPLQFGLQTFNSLMNPLMGFAGNVFDANQNAAAAQNIAGANKNAGLTSGILSSLGAVGGGVAIAV